MSEQDRIIRACNHTDRTRAEVNMDGEIVKCCCACWNASVQARREARNDELAEHYTKFAEEQKAAMASVGAQVGQRVTYFLASQIFIGQGIRYTGVIKLNRNGIAVVKLDGSHKQTSWHKGWKAA